MIKYTMQHVEDLDSPWITPLKNKEKDMLLFTAEAPGREYSYLTTMDTINVAFMITQAKEAFAKRDKQELRYKQELQERLRTIDNAKKITTDEL